MRLPPRDQLIMGVHAVREVLRYAPNRLLTLFTQHQTQKGPRSKLFDLCEEKNIPVVYVSFERLTQMVGSDSHQSLVAHVKGREFYTVAKFLEEISNQQRSLVLLLDQIFDPQNFGAILRSAECFGADGVVWSRNRGCDMTPVVAKASCGASELLRLIRISNLAEAVSHLQEGGFKALAAKATGPGAINVFTMTSFPPRTLLILGSEGEGIQPLIQKRADQTIFIPMQGKIESLNVAQTASILLALASVYYPASQTGDSSSVTN